MSGKFAASARFIAALGILYAAGLAIGLGLLVLAFQLGLLAWIDILFYRGLLLILPVFIATFALLGAALRYLSSGLGLRDAFSSAIMSLALNISFLVVVPVTVDRSISIFMLGQMAAQPDAVFTPEAMSELFTRVYVGADRQIARRLREQSVSGNVEKVGDGYRISPHGLVVVTTARTIAKLFDSHAGILPPAPIHPLPPAHPLPPETRPQN